MINATETIVINGTKEAADAIRELIDSQPGSQSHITERKNLDGNTATWIVIASIAGQALPHVLGFIKDYLATKQVKKIKVGDWEAENPTPDMVERFIAMIDAQSKQGKISD
jgi:hypothetical protein